MKIKKMLGALLCRIMVLSLFPVSASAVKPVLMVGNTSAIDNPGALNQSFYYDGIDTLTLTTFYTGAAIYAEGMGKNFKIVFKGVANTVNGVAETNKGAGIYVNGDLEIVNEGTTTISSRALTGMTEAAPAAGLYVSGNLKLSGSGNFDAIASSANSASFKSGIWAGGEIGISGGVKVKCRTSSEDSSGFCWGIYSGGDITVSNYAELDAETGGDAGNACIEVAGNVHIQDNAYVKGSSNTDSESRGIKAGGNRSIVFEGGTVIGNVATGKAMNTRPDTANTYF